MEAVGAARAPPQAALAAARRGEGSPAPRGLLAVDADAAAISFFVALWLCSATSAAFIAALRVGGEDSRAAAVTKKLFMAASLATVLLFVVASPLLLWLIGNGDRKTED